MEQSKRSLKISAFLLLFFAAMTLIRVVLGVIFEDFSSAELPDGNTDNVILISKIVLLAVAGLCLIPQVYVGVKGIKVANSPDGSKAHIIWAEILFIITVLSLISPIVGLVKNDTESDNIGALLSLLLEGSVYFEYILDARKIAKGN